MGRLEKHHRARLCGQSTKGCEPTLARREPFEGEAVGRQARQGERSDDRGRPGEHRHGHPRCHRRRNEGEAGVADRGHPRIRQHEHVDILRQGDDLSRLLRLVMLVQRDQARPVLNAEGSHEVDGGSRVFGGDDARVAECFDQPLRRIAEIADGRCGEDDHAVIVAGPRPRRAGRRCQLRAPRGGHTPVASRAASAIS